MSGPFVQKLNSAPVPPIVSATMACAMSKTRYVPGQPTEALKAIISMNDVDKRQHIIVAFLTALTVHMPEPAEVASMLEVFATLEQLPPPHDLRVIPGDFLIVRGSGKKPIKTLNVSTPSSLLASSAGARIVKMGSRGTSSMPGSAEFSFGIGMDTSLTPDRCLEILNKTGWGNYNTENLFIETCKIYKDFFYFPHVLMFGWPRMTPFLGSSMVYGISHKDIDFCAEVLRIQKIAPCVIVSTKVNDYQYIDEALPLGEVRLRLIGVDGSVRNYDFDGGEMVNDHITIEEIVQPGDYHTTMSASVRTLSGDGTRAHSLLYALNGGIMLWAQNAASSIQEGFSLSYEALMSGAAVKKIKQVAMLERKLPEAVDQFLSTR